jgi:hypothetical protein
MVILLNSNILISNFLFKLDPSRQHLSFNDESIRVCSQVLNGLSNLLYAFSRIANTCLLDNNNQQQNYFQTRLTLVHQ